MLTSNLTNKYEIFQAYYLEVNGKLISYSEALDLYAKMDADTRDAFEQYYRDETGYQIIPVAGGLDLGENVSLSSKQVYINVKYTVEAFAKRNGIILDPIWGQYSYEEIISMVENGVDIPQEVVDLAYSMAENDPLLLTDVNATSDNGEAVDKDDTFLDLIPKATKKIEECNETNEKINEEIEELLPEQQKKEKALLENQDEQMKSLRDYESIVKEWKALSDKMNNGTPLTENESNRYSELMKMLGAKQKESNDLQIDKKAIANSLSEINILAMLGETLAQETIEIGEELSEYVSEKNYKSTNDQVAGAIGFVDAAMAMAKGERIAEEAIEIGEITKEYTSESVTSVNSIANTLDIQDGIATVDENGNVVEPKGLSEENDKSKDSDKVDEFFWVTDSQVRQYISEAKAINSDLYKQIQVALNQIKVAKKDIMFSAIANKIVGKIVSEFIEREQKRNDKIKSEEAENKQAENKIKDSEATINEAKNELQKITGASDDEVDNKILKNNNSENDTNLTEEQKAEVEKQKAIIQTQNGIIEKQKVIINENNQQISEIKNESLKDRENVKQKTLKEKKIIDKAIPEEDNAKKINQAYQEKELPKHNERMDFINRAGINLMLIGTGVVTLGGRFVMIGQSLCCSPFTCNLGLQYIAFGTLAIAKGLVSIGIGATACVVSDDESLIEVAEKSTKDAGSNIGNALSGLWGVNDIMASVIEEYISSEEAKNLEGNETSATEQPTEESDGAVESESGEPEGEKPSIENAEPEIITGESEHNVTLEPVEETSTQVSENNTDAVEQPAQNTSNSVGADISAEGTNAGASNTGAVSIGADSSSKTTKKEDEEDVSPETQAKNAKSIESQQRKEGSKNESKVKEAGKLAKDDAKESKKIDKDEKKDAKQLEKESKKLQQDIKKEEEEAKKLTEESTEAVIKQQEIYKEYEILVAENETLVAADQSKSQGIMVNGEFGNSQNGNNVTGVSENTSKLLANDARITELGGQFSILANTVQRNSVKLKTIDELIKTKSQKFEKKTKLKAKKIKETQKKEQEKQKKLEKTFAVIGIFESMFGITSSVGAIMSPIGKSMQATGKALQIAAKPLQSNPYTLALGIAMEITGITTEVSGLYIDGVGKLLTIIGTCGSLACGVTKGSIQIANGNLQAGLLTLGMSAVTAVMSMAGTGGAASSAMTYVSQGLSIVADTTSLANNAMVTAGKEQNDTLSKISTVAGIGSAAVGAADGLANMKGSSTLSKVATVGNAVGVALNSTSQLMTEFGWGDQKTAELIGAIGGVVSTLSSITTVTANKMEQSKAKNNATDEARAELESEANDNLNSDKKQPSQETSEAKNGTENQSDAENPDAQSTGQLANPTDIATNPQATTTQNPENTPEITQLGVKADEVELKMADLDSRQTDSQSAREAIDTESTPEEIAAQGRAARQGTETPESKPEEISDIGRRARGYEPTNESEALAEAPVEATAEVPVEQQQTPEQIAEAGRQARGYEPATENNSSTEAPKADDKKFTWADGAEMVGKGLEAAASIASYFGPKDDSKKERKGIVGGGKSTKRSRKIKKYVMALQRYSSGRRYA